MKPLDMYNVCTYLDYKNYFFLHVIYRNVCNIYLGFSTGHDKWVKKVRIFEIS